MLRGHPLTERRHAAEARLMDHARRLYQDRFCGLKLSGQRVGYADHFRGKACEHFAPASSIAVRQPREPAAASAVTPARSVRAPLVSCVMPTFNRRSFVPQAVRYFLRQDYPAKELIVVDDGPEPVDDLLPDDPRIRYHRLETRTVLGAKRNLACDLARGPIIVHWDDDDWASPERVSVQVAALTLGQADVCGVASLLYYDPASSSAWRFTWPARFRPWAAGQPVLRQGTVVPLSVPRGGHRRGHPVRPQLRGAPHHLRRPGRLHRRDHPPRQHGTQVRPGCALEPAARPRGGGCSRRGPGLLPPPGPGMN